MRRTAIYFRLDTTPVVRLWSGFGDARLPVDNVEKTGGIYTGFGLTSIPPLQQLVNGIADRVDFTVAGVPEDAAIIASLEAEEIRYKFVTLGYHRLGADWKPLGAVRWLWRGMADILATDRKTDNTGDVPLVTRSISISVGTENAMRIRASGDTYTPLSQRRKSPPDAFCDLVPNDRVGSQKLWA